MGGGEGGGRQTGHERRQDDRENPLAPLWPLAQVDAPQCAEGGDQRCGRRKRHLETRAGQRLGLPDQHDDRCDGDSAQGQRAAVQQHRHQHHRDHDEGPFRRDIPPRERQIEGPRDQRAEGCDLLGGQPQGDDRHQRQTIAHQRKDEPRQKPHVQPRNRQEMRKVGAAKVVIGRLGDARAVTGHDRRRKTACRSGHGGLQRLGQRHAPCEDAHGRPHPVGHRQPQDGRAGIAHGTDPQKPGMALEIEPPGLGRARGRRQMTRQDQGLARCDIRDRLVAMQRDAHPRGGSFRRHARQHHAVQRQPQRVRGGTVDPDDPPLDRTVVAKGQLRGRDSLGPEFGDTEARDHKDRCDQKGGESLGHAARADQAGKGQQSQSGQNHGVGFHLLQEIHTDPDPEPDRHPGEMHLALRQQHGQKPRLHLFFTPPLRIPTANRTLGNAG